MEKFNDRQPCYKEVSGENQTNEDTIVTKNTGSQIINKLSEQQRQKKITLEIERDYNQDIEDPFVLLNSERGVYKTKITAHMS